MVAEQLPRPFRRHRRTLTLVVVATLVAVAILAVWVVTRGFIIRSSLNRARAQLVTLDAAVRQGLPLPREAAVLAAARQSVQRSYDAAHDPVFTLASDIPGLGTPLATTRGLAEAARSVVDTLSPVLAAANDLETLRSGTTVSGVIPLQPLERAAPELRRADAKLKATQASVNKLSGSWLSQVRTARRSLLSQISRLAHEVHTASIVATIAPDMLGANGPRRYFVGFVNPAEARPGGGLLGGYALLYVDRGAIKILRIGGEQSLPSLSVNPPGLPAAWLDSYDEYSAGTVWANSNMSPNFPDTARVWAAMFHQAEGVPIDGALSIDPVTMATLLAATGPVHLGVSHSGQVQLSAGNAVTFLESGEYRLPLTTAQRKAVLSDIGREIFNRLLHSHLHLLHLLKQLSVDATTHHLQLSSLHPSEEADLSPYPLSGALPQGSGPFVAALVTNASATKLDYYLHGSIVVTSSGCEATLSALTVTVRLTNEAPLSPLPAYVVTRSDAPPYKVLPHSTRVLLSLILSVGSRFLSATVDGRAIGLNSYNVDTGADATYFEQAAEGVHPMLRTFLELPPHRTRVVQLRLLQPATGGAVATWQQPLTHPLAFSQSGSGCHR